MGNRGSRPQDEQHAPTQSNRPPTVYAQYPPAPPPSRPPQAMAPYYPSPPSNGQYYGGWHPQGPTYPYPMNRPYPHGPPPGRMHHRPANQQQQQQQQQQQRPSVPPAPTQELTQTATIRNAVNLKKNTLAVNPTSDDSSRLAITFNFDASAPCVATTFIIATEDVTNGCKLTTAVQPPGASLRFEKGLGLSFPSSSTPKNIAEQHCIHLDLHQESALTTADKETYPVVIRLEVISDKGSKNGHTLDELEVPGDEQKDWIQSQTTFARLVKEEDGAWRIRVIKQKIWVEGVSYELQEIYGLEQASAASSSAAGVTTGAGGAGSTALSGGGGDDGEERLCVICLVNLRDTTVLPCRHMCMCHECAKELRKQSSKCPICRNHVESLLHIRIANKDGGEEMVDQEQKQ